MGKQKGKQKQPHEGADGDGDGAVAVAAVAKGPGAEARPRLDMRALEAVSDDEEGSLPPEDEWNQDAKNLRDAIMSGKFDHVLEREDGDASSVEEVELDDHVDEEDADPDDNSDDEDEKGNHKEEKGTTKRGGNKTKSSSSSEEKSEAESEDEDEVKKSKPSKPSVQDQDQSSSGSSDGDSDTPKEEIHSRKMGTVPHAGESKSDSESDGSHDDDEESDDDGKDDDSPEQKNQTNSRALQVVMRELELQKKGWSWAETFDIIPDTPLPFDRKANPENYVDIHDDLKREVSFYDVALEAVNAARSRCQQHGIPFSRPDDYFAEMVKTDDHMAKIKDRLIFENKKMEAVATRKTNKEQKLRVKESQAHRAAEKSKRRREHFKSLEDWQASGSRNDSALLDALEGKGPNKKRLAANKKYGFGGQRPRFKQNEKKDLNDTSKFNPRGNFPGGMKRSASSGKKGGGGNRPGKRARDAKRSRS